MTWAWYAPSNQMRTWPPGPTRTGKPGDCWPLGASRTSPPFGKVSAADRSGAAYEEVWRRLVQPEKDRDPDKKGFAVLIKVERAENLDGQLLTLA